MESFSAETNSTELPSQTLDDPHLILSMVILGLTFLLGLPGNGLVLWVAGLKMRRTVTTLWFLHLTVADFLCCLSLPFSLVHLILQGYWPYGWFLCKLIPSVIVLNMFASVFLLTAISVDRCLVVFKPVWCQNHRNAKTADIVCGCIWVMALIMCIPVFIYRETDTFKGHCRCGYNFGPSSSYDYSGFPFLDPYLLGNMSLHNFSFQLPEEMNNVFDPSSFQTNNQLWTTDLHSQAPQRPSGDSLQNSPSQPPQDTLFKPTSVVPPTSPSGLPMEEHRMNVLGHSGAFLATDSELLPSTSSNSLYTSELSQYFQYSYLDEFTYTQPTLTPLFAITLTRLVVGFLLPLVIMVICYGLIVFRMRQSRRFANSGSKTVRVALVVVTVFLVCWAPYHVVGVLSLFAHSAPFMTALASWDHLSTALASANSCFNPFLYALLGKDFRKKARQSLQGILEAAFSEELTPSTNCTQSNVMSERNSVSTTV
ncbi:C3a anaphylatoxin chemotactic receptor isoform X1 [Ochotona curzoniae]|uniref:C3a anaphylatoxin chemotactic receptor isoform X1 n=2 Tax=Ochotona curzoniae TaxID=130825 RepID=UPI001B353952|nr:C3a anaphylatoxin chemotactic receptor isoform X1 [Ochotona curzoniae]XP_040834783.1 C3a anaphylatoxin chemotactic receptor isoform X1 [Ochotona curzoniae]